MNHERERVNSALADLDAALHRLDMRCEAERARVRASSFSRLAGSGFATGLIAALVPLRAWPQIAANLVRVGSGVVRLPIAPVLLAAASKKMLRKAAERSDRVG